VQYLQGRHIIDKMVRHIGLYSIMELLIMIGWDDGTLAEPNATPLDVTVRWRKRERERGVCVCVCGACFVCVLCLFLM
jgi:hypothetical protein